MRDAARFLSAGVLSASISASAATPQPSLPSSSPAPNDLLAPAYAALQSGEVDKALAQLQALPKPVSAQAHNLACRVRFTLEQWDAAIKECEQAVALDGQNSEYHLWLGRALGEKADRASFLSAYSLAKRVRAEFEEAVRLNPHNAEALADLGEFYKDAPGVVGGGIDKAQQIAARLDGVDPARAHELRGRIAHGRKDYETAEREFKQAIAAGAHPALQWVTIASFYRQREQWTQMESAVRSVISLAEHDKHAAVALYDGASVLTEAKRDPELAIKMLHEYLASPSKTEEAPTFVAYTRLARLEAQLGNTAGAQRERAAAIALAHEYKPAQDSGAQETKH